MGKNGGSPVSNKCKTRIIVLLKKRILHNKLLFVLMSNQLRGITSQGSRKILFRESGSWRFRSPPYEMRLDETQKSPKNYSEPLNYNIWYIRSGKRFHRPVEDPI